MSLSPWRFVETQPIFDKDRFFLDAKLFFPSFFLEKKLCKRLPYGSFHAKHTKKSFRCIKCTEGSKYFYNSFITLPSIRRMHILPSSYVANVGSLPPLGKVIEPRLHTMPSFSAASSFHKWV